MKIAPRRHRAHAHATDVTQACEGFDPSKGAPVLNVQVRAGAGQTPRADGTMGTTFAFVEFRDEEVPP